MKMRQKLSALFAEIVKEAQSNPGFAERLEQILVSARPAKVVPVRANRRKAALIDPFAEYEHGEAVLRERLKSLDLEALRDVLAQYGMDRAKLAMKWKDEGRIADLIVKSVAARATKGDVFRNDANRASPGINRDDVADT